MSIASDMRGIIREVGTVLSILRNVEISGEYAEFKTNSQVTKPFIREHFLEGRLPYDSDIVPGDVVKSAPTSDVLLAMNITDFILENTCVYKESVFYRCNVSGELLRSSGEVRNPFTLQLQPVYMLIKQNCYGVISDTEVGTDILQNEKIGQIETTKQFLFVPRSVGIKPLDIYIPYSGEYYKVESIEKFRFPAVDFCVLVENTID